VSRESLLRRLTAALNQGGSEPCSLVRQGMGKACPFGRHGRRGPPYPRWRHRGGRLAGRTRRPTTRTTVHRSGAYGSPAGRKKGSVIPRGSPAPEDAVLERMARDARGGCRGDPSGPGDAVLTSTGACPPSGVGARSRQSARSCSRAPQRQTVAPSWLWSVWWPLVADFTRRNAVPRGYRGSRDLNPTQFRKVDRISWSDLPAFCHWPHVWRQWLPWRSHIGPTERRMAK